MKALKLKISALHFKFEFPPDEPCRLTQFSINPRNRSQPDSRVAKWARIVEIQANGHDWNDHHGNKYTGTNPGGQLRYLRHSRSRNPIGEKLEIVQAGGGLEVTSHYQFLGHQSVFRTWTEVVNVDERALQLEYVSTAAFAGVSLGGDSVWDQKMHLHLADNTWGGEAQWRSGPLDAFGLSQVYSAVFDTGFSMKRISIANQGSWSTEGHLPLGALENTQTGETLFWQIEHNGSWHWEVSDLGRELYLRVSGPTYREGHWTHNLAPGERFLSVPATIGRISGGLETALQSLTSTRRMIRLPHPDNAKLPVIFNDYMNCLMAEPTTEKLLPVIAAAAAVGSEYFVVDAGWFAAASETWWTSVGEWKESPDRFPGGFTEIMDAIRDKGMIPGLWLEIEVVGTTSPVAAALPDSWFFRRNGQRIIDHGRYQLDFRNPEVRTHAHGIVDRVIADYGVGYIKNDYNINAGPGTDVANGSPGRGLLEHNRAFLEWIDEVMVRHPSLVIENCASGGMRMDYASLARHSIQSTSDQTDYRLTGIIAAAAASAVTPEQAAVWSYPLAEASREEVIFNMVNALLLRVHQSGRIHELPPRRLKLIREAIDYYKSIRSIIPTSTPIWPLGLARFGSNWAAFGLVCKTMTFLAVWRFDSKSKEITIPLPQFAGRSLNIKSGFPAVKSPFWKWSSKRGELRIRLNHPFTARIIVIST